jgi:hypothetical protein
MVSQRFELGSDLVTTATEKQAELTGLHLQTGKLLAGNAATISSRVSAAVPFVVQYASCIRMHHEPASCVTEYLIVRKGGAIVFYSACMCCTGDNHRRHNSMRTLIALALLGTLLGAASTASGNLIGMLMTHRLGISQIAF